MPRRKQALQWEVWSHDARVHFARTNGGLYVSAPGLDGMSQQSDWCRLIGHSVDVTVRRLLHEIKWKPKAE